MERQPDNEIWSVNRRSYKKYFAAYHTENKTERLVPDFFLFFKKALYEVKASGLQLSFDIFR